MSTKEPRILFLDLETIADMREVMKVFPSLGDYPGRTLKATINSIICFGYRWLDEPKAHVISAWDDPKRWRKNINDDSWVVRRAHAIVSQADAIVTWNGKKFDEKFLRTRIFVHELPPIPKVPHIDLCVIARSNLLAYSNSLKSLAPILTGDKKMEHDGWALWVRVSNRDKKAQDLMAAYCKQDVNVMLPIFKRLKPLIKNIPNYNLWTDAKRPLCPACGSTRLRSDGIRATSTRAYRRLNCKDCGSPSRVDVSGKNPRSV